MKLLLFQAASFGFSPEALEMADPIESESGLIVVFVHGDPGDENRTGLERKVAKQIKWLANKRQLKTVCLHSFAHLGEEKGDPEFAEAFIQRLAQRLSEGGYQVVSTPFGESCAWRLSVFQESLAKVFKQL